MKKFNALNKHYSFNGDLKQYLVGKDRYFFDLSEEDVFVEQLDIVNYMITEKIWNLSYQENISYLKKFDLTLAEMDFYELMRVSQFILNVGMQEKETIVQKIKETIVKYCSENIHQWVVDDDVFHDVVEADQYDEDILIEYVNNILQDFKLNFDEHDYEKIFDEIDVDSIISANQEAFAESSYHEDEAYERFREDRLIFDQTMDPIDELFDRS